MQAPHATQQAAKHFESLRTRVLGLRLVDYGPGGLHFQIGLTTEIYCVDGSGQVSVVNGGVGGHAAADRYTLILKGYVRDEAGRLIPPQS